MGAVRAARASLLGGECPAVDLAAAAIVRLASHVANGSCFLIDGDART